ncbi:TauD/TfdA family dioxygenase [Streptomyces niveus]|uniref:TauD/TfdA family dioxygenase n=1 Tax=Streptomyces niveus TaxID=193462 RepID=UPI0036381EC8
MSPTATATPATALDVSREAGKPAVLRTPSFDAIDPAIAWLTDQRTAVRDELHRSGALLIRGLGVGDAADFGRVRDVLMPRRAGYKEKATPRTDFGEGVFSSTDLPAVQPIRLHNENSYTLDFPGTLLFGCVTAPAEDGATTVGDMREALRLLPADLRDRFMAKGWLLTRNFSELAGLPWQKSFATEDPVVAEAYCRENAIGYEWLPDGGLRTRQRRSAVVTHPVTGEKSWFNHFAFWNNRTLDADVREVLLETYGDDGLPFDTYLGDGTRLTADEVDAINRVYDQVTVRETWQRGDVMLVDNVLNAHGRESFKGDRKILVAMGDPITLDACRPETAPATTAFGE